MPSWLDNLDLDDGEKATSEPIANSDYFLYKLMSHPHHHVPGVSPFLLGENNELLASHPTKRSSMEVEDGEGPRFTYFVKALFSPSLGKKSRGKRHWRGFQRPGGAILLG